MPDVAHLTVFNETLLGAIQREEALLLHGLLRVTRPQTVIEIGFLRGRSALNFLTALTPEARLYSFDTDPISRNVAAARFRHDPRFTFRERSQSELTAADVDGRAVDFAFVDGSHDLEANQALFARLLPLMSPECIVAVHDTGTVPRELFPWRHLPGEPNGWIGDEYEAQPGERAFVNWLRSEHSDFAQINLHALRTVRCGLTLLQRSGALPRPPGRG